MKHIVGICGLIGTGKDTIANHLIRNHKFKKLSFAASLKDAVAAVFGWDRKLLEGDTPQSRQWREEVDVWWATRLNIPHLTPRWVLQHWGTEVCRQGFHEDIWVASLEHKLHNAAGSVVITDCRFPNEVDAIKNAGGTLINVRRGELPNWHPIALNACAGCKTSAAHLKDIGVHFSEWSWASTNFDYVIQNQTTFNELFQQINGIVDLINSRQQDHLVST